MKNEELDDLLSLVPPPLGQPDTMELRFKIAKAVVCWLAVKEIEQGNGPDRSMMMRIDMDHSALLYRLFEGKPPLQDVPPKCMSRPWYSLIEKGYAEDVISVSTYDRTVVIDNHPWKLVRKLRNGYIVEHERAKGQWKVWCTCEETLQGGHVLKSWRIERYKPGKKGR